MVLTSRRFKIAMLLDGKGGARSLNDDEVDAWTEADDVLWVDVNQNNQHGCEWLEHQSGLDPNVASILLTGETRPRSVAEANSLVVILRGINMNPGAVPDDMIAIRMSLQKHRIVTSHRRKALSLDDLQGELIAGKGPKTSGEFLVDLTVCLSERIEAAIENIEQMIDELDDSMSGGNIEAIRGKLGIVRRQAAAIRRHLAPQREALDRIARSNAAMLSDDEAFDLREIADHVIRQVEDLDLVRENALVTQEELMNRVALEQNSRMYLLSIVAAIFLPLTFVTGVLGMNVAGLPGTENPQGFLYSAVLMAVCLVGLVSYFRWRKWL